MASRIVGDTATSTKGVSGGRQALSGVTGISRTVCLLICVMVKHSVTSERKNTNTLKMLDLLNEINFMIKFLFVFSMSLGSACIGRCKNPRTLHRA